MRRFHWHRRIEVPRRDGPVPRQERPTPAERALALPRMRLAGDPGHGLSASEHKTIADYEERPSGTRGSRFRALKLKPASRKSNPVSPLGSVAFLKYLETKPKLGLP